LKVILIQKTNFHNNFHIHLNPGSIDCFEYTNIR